MPKVICVLENASEEINGVKFAPHQGEGLLSAEIEEHVAAIFLSITGYHPFDETPKETLEERKQRLAKEQADQEAVRAAAEKKAREEAEAAAKVEADAKAAAEKKAAEEKKAADKKAKTEAAAKPAETKPDDTSGSNNSVF